MGVSTDAVGIQRTVVILPKTMGYKYLSPCAVGPGLLPVPGEKQFHHGLSRNQGVDYTSTEMDLHFGRIMEKDGKPNIKAIDYNKQAEEGIQSIYEEDARKLYRKWDNVKHISEALKENG